MITNVAIATVTAYCAGKCCCGPNAKGITASGKKPVQGITIAAPRKIPLGTKVVISEKTYTVQDRMSKKYDLDSRVRFDVFFTDHQNAKQFGARKINCLVID